MATSMLDLSNVCGVGEYRSYSTILLGSPRRFRLTKFGKVSIL